MSTTVYDNESDSVLKFVQYIQRLNLFAWVLFFVAVIANALVSNHGNSINFPSTAGWVKLGSVVPVVLMFSSVFFNNWNEQSKWYVDAAMTLLAIGLGMYLGNMLHIAISFNL